MEHRTGLPEAGVIVEFGDFLQTELFIIVRADPFGGIDRALLERGVDIVAGELLRNRPNLLKNLGRQYPLSETSGLPDRPSS